MTSVGKKPPFLASPPPMELVIITCVGEASITNTTMGHGAHASCGPVGSHAGLRNGHVRQYSAESLHRGQKSYQAVLLLAVEGGRREELAA